MDADGNDVLDLPLFPGTPAATLALVVVSLPLRVAQHALAALALALFHAALHWSGSRQDYEEDCE